MNRLYLVSISVLALAVLAGGFASRDNSAAASGQQVICKIVKINGKRRVSCPKAQLQGKRGPRGIAGPQGATGPTGAPGATGATGAGSGLTLNFNAKLEPTKTKKLVIGNFTIRVTAGNNGECGNVELLTGGTEGFVSIGPGSPFTSMGLFATQPILTSDTSNMFTAVSADGRRTVSGIVGRKFSGGFCLVSGYVTGV